MLMRKFYLFLFVLSVLTCGKAQATGANGIGILIPCHRVIGSNRSLTGFRGGLDKKEFLLELERDCLHK